VGRLADQPPAFAPSNRSESAIARAMPARRCASAGRASARSLQIGQGVEVIALTSVAANLAAILGGILVFHEPVGSGALAIAARFLAFCLVIAGAALIPARMRATPDN
jgi:hypothetical protein